MNKLMKKKKKGFTLIELIAVIAILAILAVIAVPRVISYVEKSKKVAIQTEATTIYNAAEASYNNGTLDGVTSSDSFNKATVTAVVADLEKDNLLNSGDKDVAKLGTATTLNDLKGLMNADVNEITYDASGNLTGTFDQSTGVYSPAK
ncbi:type II secretion system protein [Clostridium sp. Ade.TY]|uniref:type IV pilin protein n=1 Tax=Clostridium sp. Ade.TY TaxID=1391647 RepID=UPI00041CD919|nr:type II secretion system protein [Clostridium sp. Ade.TY]